ncbi:hypothetical protein LXL04_031410 [Taraxacum kok-saghyz]
MHLTGYFLLFKSRCSRFHLTQSYIRVHSLNFKLGLSSFTPRNPSSSHSITACISSFSPQAGARLSLQPQQSAAPPHFPKTSSTHSPIPAHPPSFIEAHLVDNFIHQAHPSSETEIGSGFSTSPTSLITNKYLQNPFPFQLTSPIKPAVRFSLIPFCIIECINFG